MNSASDVIAAILAAMDDIDGLRPAAPLNGDAWWPLDARGLAVELAPTNVEVRVIASRLPLRPLLDNAYEAVRVALADTTWSEARVCLVVTDLDAAAFGEEGRTT